MIAEAHRADRADDAEAALLGSIVVLPEFLDEVASSLLPADFVLDSHRIVFEAFRRLRAEGSPIDPVSVARHLQRIGRLADVGGADGLNRLMESTPDAHNAGYYTSLVLDASNRRRLTHACSESIQQARDGSTDFEEAMSLHESKLQAINERSAGLVAVEAHEAFSELLQEIDEPTVGMIETGWLSLDSTLSNGFRPGQLIVLAARPSVGKTALACGLVLNIASAHHRVLFTSLEMTRREIAARLASAISGISCSSLSSGCLSEDQNSKLHSAGNRLYELPIAIDDTARRTVAQIAAQARVQKRKHGLGILLLDYIQLLQADDVRATRDQQVSAMSRGLKCLAKDLGIPLVVLAQLNRDIEKRENKRPRLSDLRESGAIEQDADIVMFLDRPATYDRNADPREANLIIAKHRNGPTGTARLVWNPETMTFSDSKWDV